jgi:hypothetical protein
MKVRVVDPVREIGSDVILIVLEFLVKMVNNVAKIFF